MAKQAVDVDAVIVPLSVINSIKNMDKTSSKKGGFLKEKSPFFMGLFR